MQIYRESHSHRNGTDTMGKTSRWVILGSRPLTTFLGQILPRNEYRKVASHVPKRLPPKSWAVIGAIPKAFDDDEDEDD